MRDFMVVLGILQIVGGIVVFGGAQSAIHEILGTLGTGFGILTIAIAGIISELRAIRSTIETSESNARQRHQPVKSIADAFQAMPLSCLLLLVVWG